jgi:perosamine synthetase
MLRRVPVYTPALTADDAEAVAEAVRTGWVAAGQAIAGFERAWANACGMPHGVATSSGTAALELAVHALGLGPGDEVLCPTFAIVSCVRAIVAAGATPVLVDSDPRTFNLDLGGARRRVTPKTRAILVVHTYGHPVDARALAAFAREHQLRVIEDAAEAHGVEVLTDSGWARCGSLGDVSVFSFFGNKAITTGEGGMLLARDEGVRDRARAHLNLYFEAQRRFHHAELGINYRMSNLQATLGLSQVPRLDGILAIKRRVGDRYRDALRDAPGIELQAREAWARTVPWMTAIVLADEVGVDAAEVARRLDQEGIETRPFFQCAHEQPAFTKRGLFAGEHHPVAERLARRGLYLPSGLDLDDETIDRVASTLRNATRFRRS